MIRNCALLTILLFAIAACSSNSGGSDSADGVGISSSPTGLTFLAAPGQKPAAQSLTISYEGDGVAATSPSGTALPDWLTLAQQTTGSTTRTFSVEVATAGNMAPQTLSTVIRFTTDRSGTDVRFVDVPVTYQISNSPVAISAEPTSLSFQAVQDASLPSTQNLQVDFTGAMVEVGSTNNLPPPSWLDCSLQQTDPNRATLAVSIASTSLAPQTYTATIRLIVRSADNAQQEFLDIPVEYRVLAEALAISVNPDQLLFSAVSGGTVPAAQSLAVTYTGTSASVKSAPAWVDVTPSPGGSSPQGFQVRPKTTAYAPGSVFTGDIVLQTTAAGGATRTAGVSIRYDIGVPNKPTAHNRYHPILTEAGGIQLYDPENPGKSLDIVTSGVRLNTGIGHIKAGQFDSSRGGLVDPRLEHVIYALDGRVYSLSLQKGGTPPVPRQISSVNNACFAHAIPDYENVQNSLVYIYTPRESNCDSWARPVYAKFSDGHMQGARTITLSQFAAPKPVRNANGGISGYIELEQIANNRQQLVHWNSDLAVKEVVATMPEKTFTSISLISPAAGSYYMQQRTEVGHADFPATKLLRYDDATRQFTQIYSFDIPPPTDFENFVAVDSESLFFSNGWNEVRKVGHRASASTVVAAIPDAKFIASAVKTSGSHIVFLAREPNQGPISLMTVPKTGGEPLTVLTNLPVSDTRLDYASGGWVYLSRMNSDVQERRAYALRTDGSQLTEYEYGTWDYATAPTDFVPLGWNATYEVRNVVLVQHLSGGPSTTLTSFDASTGTLLGQLGNIPGGEWFVGFARPASSYGRYLMFYVGGRTPDRIYSQDDIYRADMETASSLLPAASSQTVTEVTIMSTVP